LAKWQKIKNLNGDVNSAICHWDIFQKIINAQTQLVMGVKSKC